MKRLSTLILFSWVAALLGCAPSIERIQKHITKGEYEKALISVKGDPAGQVELAALLLEQAAANETQPAELISILSSCGAPGKRALERLAENGEDPARSLAQIALSRCCSPKKVELALLLTSEYSDVRAAAVCAWHGKLDIDQIGKLILDPDHRVRRCALEGLTGNGDHDKKKVSSMISESLRLDPVPSVRAMAAKAGKLIQDDGLLKLKRALEDENMGVRLAAISGLAELNEEEGLDVLLELSNNPMDESVIAASAELARLGNEQGKKRLLEALEDTRPSIRETALLRMERAQFPNREEFFTKALDDQSPAIVLLAASSLLRNDSFVASVKKTLKKISKSGLSKNNEARDMLTRLGDEDSIVEVRNVLESAGPDVVVTVLGRTKLSTDLFPDFVRLMAHEDNSVRIAAGAAVLASSFNHL